MPFLNYSIFTNYCSSKYDAKGKSRHSSALRFVWVEVPLLNGLSCVFSSTKFEKKPKITVYILSVENLQKMKELHSWRISILIKVFT